jgi:hypothetical protein
MSVPMHDLFEVHLDATLIVNFIIKKADGTVEDISAWTGDKIKFSLAEQRGGPKVVNLTIGAGIEIVNGAAGMGRVVMTDAYQDDLEPRTYWDELWVDGTEGPSVQSWGRTLVHRSQNAVTS